MQIVIEIDEERYEDTKRIASVQMNYRTPTIEQIVANGTPLDKHDEEVIKETVESIWGKPPYTELLDKIRAEIVEEAKGTMNENRAGGLYKALQIIDKYREEQE